MKSWMLIVFSCLVLAGCIRDRAVPEANEAVVEEMSREDLEKENLALKRENRALRRELVRQRQGEPSIDLSRVREQKGGAGEDTNGRASDDGGFWLATEKMRRHNSKCKYYKLGRGRPCQKDEGTPCKRCGG